MKPKASSSGPRFGLKKVTYPNIGFPREPRPEVPAAVFASRLVKLRKRMAERELDALVIYADREHFANLLWLTNYDPRFEEALLVVLPKGKPVLFVGNEGWSYSNIVKLAVDRRLHQTFSLLGQPREKVQPLASVLKEAGLAGCSRVGVAGWKYFSAAEFENPQEVLDAPDFVCAVGASRDPGRRHALPTRLLCSWTRRTACAASWSPSRLPTSSGWRRIIRKAFCREFARSSRA